MANIKREKSSNREAIGHVSLGVRSDISVSIYVLTSAYIYISPHYTYGPKCCRKLCGESVIRTVVGVHRLYRLPPHKTVAVKCDLHTCYMLYAAMFRCVCHMCVYIWYAFMMAWSELKNRKWKLSGAFVYDDDRRRRRRWTRRKPAKPGGMWVEYVLPHTHSQSKWG